MEISRNRRQQADRHELRGDKGEGAKREGEYTTPGRNRALRGIPVQGNCRLHFKLTFAQRDTGAAYDG